MLNDFDAWNWIIKTKWEKEKILVTSIFSFSNFVLEPLNLIIEIIWVTDIKESMSEWMFKSRWVPPPPPAKHIKQRFIALVYKRKLNTFKTKKKNSHIMKSYSYQRKFINEEKKV